MKQLIIAALLLTLTATLVRAHEHHAPHGGTLVELGREFAHAEFVLDPETGSLTVYILDGEAENSVRIGQESIEVVIEETVPPAGASGNSHYTLILSALPNVLTGETTGDTSEFAAQTDKLRGVRKFTAVIPTLNVKGQAFKNIEFSYPEGNE